MSTSLGATQCSLSLQNVWGLTYRPWDRLNLPSMCTQQKMVFLMLGGVGVRGLTVRIAGQPLSLGQSMMKMDPSTLRSMSLQTSLLPQQSNGILTTAVTLTVVNLACTLILNWVMRLCVLYCIMHMYYNINSTHNIIMWEEIDWCAQNHVHPFCLNLWPWPWKCANVSFPIASNCPGMSMWLLQRSL